MAEDFSEVVKTQKEQLAATKKASGLSQKRLERAAELTEQIDALEVMGVNSINYLVFPKTIAMLLYPFVISIAMFLGIIGGMAACVYGGFSTLEDYITGSQLDFIPFHSKVTRYDPLILPCPTPNSAFMPSFFNLILS